MRMSQLLDHPCSQRTDTRLVVPESPDSNYSNPLELLIEKCYNLI
jgi:hypothetical protein